MKYLILLTVIYSFSSYGGGTVGGSSGSTGDNVIVIPTEYKDQEIDIEYGKSCLTDLDPTFDFSGMKITVNELKTVIENKINKPRPTQGRSIASIETTNSAKSKPVSCKLFARGIGDPKFLDLVVPREKVAPIETPMPVNGTLTR